MTQWFFLCMNILCRCIGTEFLQPFALLLAIFLVILEVVLGVMLLLGFIVSLLYGRCC
jgi:uncharacterized membrane protein YphA (DoxX/SURF4 family)